jgi:hypothetical protein
VELLIHNHETLYSPNPDLHLRTQKFFTSFLKVHKAQAIYHATLAVDMES